jgi:hypothetical protein
MGNCSCYHVPCFAFTLSFEASLEGPIPYIPFTLRNEGFTLLTLLVLFTLFTLSFEATSEWSFEGSLEGSERERLSEHSVSSVLKPTFSPAPVLAAEFTPSGSERLALFRYPPSATFKPSNFQTFQPARPLTPIESHLSHTPTP